MPTWARTPSFGGSSERSQSAPSIGQFGQAVLGLGVWRPPPLRMPAKSFAAGTNKTDMVPWLEDMASPRFSGTDFCRTSQSEYFLYRGEDQVLPLVRSWKGCSLPESCLFRTVAHTPARDDSQDRETRSCPGQKPAAICAP